MPTFPTYVKLGWRDTAEHPAPVMLRTPMERGIPRHRRIAADSLVSVPVTAYFDSAADSLAFDSWFFGEAEAGAAWFDFTLPRTGQVVQARVVDGDIGQLKPATKNWAFSERSFQLEYIRPGFVQLAPGLHSVDASRILSVQRNSTATYIDPDGVVRTAAPNVARWQGGQLLVEAASTNYVPESDFATPAVLAGGGSTSHVAAILPSGVSAYASEYVTSGSAAILRIGVYGGASAASPHVGSLWVRSLSDALIMSINCNEGPVTGFVPTPVWQRVQAAQAPLGIYAYAFLDLRIDGGAAGRKVELCMAQVEPGVVANSYIRTGVWFASRAADIITVAA